jgi:hypothetical protein
MSNFTSAFFVQIGELISRRWSDCQLLLYLSISYQTTAGLYTQIALFKASISLDMMRFLLTILLLCNKVPCLGIDGIIGIKLVDLYFHATMLTIANHSSATVETDSRPPEASILLPPKVEGLRGKTKKQTPRVAQVSLAPRVTSCSSSTCLSSSECWSRLT